MAKTLISTAKDWITDLITKAKKWSTSKEGATAIGVAIAFFGLGSTVSTKEGRQALATLLNGMKENANALRQTAGIKTANEWVKGISKSIAAKITNGATAVAGAVLAGYVTGLVAGDYFKGDAKNFGRQFGQDLVLNLTTGPAGSIVKHVIVNKDMVISDIKKNVLNPIANIVSNVAAKVGVLPTASAKGEQVESAPTSATVTPLESGKQVVEHEKNKKGYQTPVQTTSDKMVEYMSKNFKKQGLGGRNDAAWYVKGKALKLMAGTFTWTTVKDNDRDGVYPFAGIYTLNTMLNIPTIGDAANNNRIHPRIAEQVNLITAALRGKNTGAYSYNEEDVYNYIIEMAVIIARYNSIRRNLSILNRSNPFVEKEAEHMFNALYFNATAYSSAIPDRPNYVSRLNALATVINAKAVPAISLISKWNYMASKMFKDYNGDKAVIGQFNLITWPTVDRSTGKVTANYRIGNTIDADIAELESQVASLGAIPSNMTTQAGVVNKISADFTKLLGANKATFDNVPYTSIADLVEVKFDKAVFDQLHNAMVIGNCNNSAGNVRYASYDGTASFHITNSTTISNASANTLASGAVPGCYDWNTTKFAPWLLTLDSQTKEKSGAENIEITQFCFTSRANIVAGTGVTKFERVFIDTPAALIMFGKVMYYVPQSSNINEYAEYGSQTLDTGVDASKDLVEMSVEKQIDFYLPKISFKTVGANVHCLGQDTDVDNYAYLNDNQFYYMNNVATYSLFHLYDPEDLQIKGILDVA